MRTTVYIAASLDGFIARKDGNIDWLLNIENPEKEDYGYKDFIRQIDAIVMGRGTFEKVLSFPSWPYDRPVFVLSTSLKRIPDFLQEKVSVLPMRPTELLPHLAGLGHSNLYIDGGKTIQSFLREDLIDALIVTRAPLLLGDGIPLFGPLENDLGFRHIETRVYSNGLVKSHYERKRP